MLFIILDFVTCNFTNSGKQIALQYNALGKQCSGIWWKLLEEGTSLRQTNNGSF